MFKSAAENLTAFEAAIDNLNNVLEPVIKDPIADTLVDASGLEKAKTYLAMLYTVNSAVWAFLRATGKDPRNLPIKQEIDRIRDYMKRAKEVESSLVRQEPTMRVNKAAAKRTVKHALWQAAQGSTKSSLDDNIRTDADTINVEVQPSTSLPSNRKTTKKVRTQ